MPDSDRGPIHRKIAFMGYPCVGKSSIILRYVQGHFPDAYNTTIEDTHNKLVTFRGKKYDLHIIDTAGQQRHSLFPRSCMVDIHGYVLVYAINNRESYDVIQIVRDKILDTVGEVAIPMVLVGNKLDLQHVEREVTTEEATKLATSWSAAFLETSAKENNQVETIFERILYEIEVANGNIQPEKPPNKCTIS